ncbi:MAG: EcsC family protein [Propionibacteriaceae bacterium]|jgi:hypothetical protein|nr:EcsC family protein [Propionibacteriaceae bacterium]
MPSAATVKTVATEVAGAVMVGLPQLAPDKFSAWLLKLIDLAVDGGPGLPPAKKVAARHLERRQDVDAAIGSLTRLHIGLASAQGFVTNVGGGLAALVGMPANVAGIVIVQIRLAACIAHLHGYDIEDPRVRTALVMCLLGNRRIAKQVKAGELPGTPLVVATAPVHDVALANEVARNVLSDVLADLGTKDLAGFIARKIPLVGGGVGAVVDGYNTSQVARCARSQLVTRRPALA